MRLLPPTVDSAREWAEEGLGELWEGLSEKTFPLSHEEVGEWLRAAYGQGYVNALAEREATIVTDALEHNAILQVLVPVT